MTEFKSSYPKGIMMSTAKGCHGVSCAPSLNMQLLSLRLNKDERKLLREKK